MHRSFLLFFSLCLVNFSFSQQLSTILSAAVNKLESDAQFKHAIIAFQVVESGSGKPVFSKNSEIGLSVASSQKVFTAAAALELLGSDYRYSTELRLTTDRISNGSTDATLVVVGAGDPTLGSWRYKGATDIEIFTKWVAAIKAKGIRRINGGILIPDPENSGPEASPIPDGYIWQDIGNYYGAGTTLANWHENEYDIIFRSAATGTPAIISDISPDPGFKLNSSVTAGIAGSGDNAYVYSGPFAKTGYLKGTIPPLQTRFVVSGSFPDPAKALAIAFRTALEKNGINIDSSVETSTSKFTALNQTGQSLIEGSRHYSPPLDSIVYWFLKKSINLYGEALVKTLSKEANGSYSMEKGLAILTNFWSRQGVEASAFHIGDGSGLSPGNRVTASALVRVMQFAKTRPWFSSFYQALPAYNGIRMKSGTINGVKSFTGYLKNTANKEFTFAIVVNNFDGNASQVVQKIYALLNLLK